MRRRAFLGGLGAAGCLTFTGRLEAGARPRVIERLRAAKVEIVSRVTLLAGAPDETIAVTLASTGAGTAAGADLDGAPGRARDHDRARDQPDVFGLVARHLRSAAGRLLRR